MNNILWSTEKAQKYLKDKITNRGVDPTEYEFLSKFLNNTDIDVFIDVGYFLGISTNILSSSIKDVKKIYAIENIDSNSYCEYVLGDKPISKSEYGKYAPSNTIFKNKGYEIELEPLLKKHYNDKIFVFLDAAKLPQRVLQELKICYDNNADYIGVHDTSLWYRYPRNAVKHSVNLGWFKFIDEINKGSRNERTKGATILRLNK